MRPWRANPRVSVSIVASDFADSPESITYVSTDRLADDHVSGTASWVTIADPASASSGSTASQLGDRAGADDHVVGALARAERSRRSIAAPPW